MYGYSRKTTMTEDPNSPAALVNFGESIIKFQKFMGLQQTGELDEQTLKMMSKSRCGNRDFDTEEVNLLFIKK